MARVYKFAQKEYGIESELITLEGQADASFTYNGKQVLTLGTGSNTFAAQFNVNAPIAQTALNNADSVIVYTQSVANSPSSGISLNAGTGVVTVTKPGVYLVNVVVQFESAFAGGNWGGGIVKQTGTLSGVQLNHPLSAAATVTGIGYTNVNWQINKTTAATTPGTIIITLNGVGVGGTATGYKIVNASINLTNVNAQFA